MTQVFLLEKYGPRIAPDELADVLGIAAGTVRNKISAGTFPIRTQLDLGRRFADYRDVAEYLDAARVREDSPA